MVTSSRVGAVVSKSSGGDRPPTKSSAAATAARRRRKKGRGSVRGRARPRVRREGARHSTGSARPAYVRSGSGRAGWPDAPSRRLLVPTRPLHIVMVGWEWPPHHTGGLGVHSFELCQELTKLGHRITFLCPFSGPFTPVPGVTFRFPGGPVGDTPAAYPAAYWSGGTPDSPFWNSTDGYNSFIADLPGLDAVDVVHVHDWFGTVGAARHSRGGIGLPPRDDRALDRVRPLARPPVGAHPGPGAARNPMRPRGSSRSAGTCRQQLSTGIRRDPRRSG